MNDKGAKEEKEVYDKIIPILESKKWISGGEWSNKEVEIINKSFFLTSKSVVYLVNLSDEDFIKKKNKWLPKIKEWVDSHVPGIIIPYSASYE